MYLMNKAVSYTHLVAYIQYSDHPKHYRICKADKYLRNSHETAMLDRKSTRLNSIFKENRKEFEEKWDDLKIFIDVYKRQAGIPDRWDGRSAERIVQILAE